MPTVSVRLKVKQFVSTSPHVSNPTLRLQVPAGWLILGGGATTNWNGTDPGNLLVSCYPMDQQTWIAESKDHQVPSPAELTVTVIALDNSEDQFETRIFSATSEVRDHPIAMVSVDSGYIMTGGGAKAEPSNPGQLLTATFPQTSNLWEARSKDHGIPSPGTVTAYAIGLRRRVPGPMPVARVFPSAESGSSAYPQATVSIGSGYTLIGGGARVTPSNPNVGNLLSETIPFANGWRARSKDHAVPCPATIAAFAIAIEQ